MSMPITELRENGAELKRMILSKARNPRAEHADRRIDR
jgi:hypothetical protein